MVKLNAHTLRGSNQANSFMDIQELFSWCDTALRKRGIEPSHQPLDQKSKNSLQQHSSPQHPFSLHPLTLFTQCQPSITTLLPAQAKAVRAGLFEGNSQLICTPTASGKTLIGELAALYTIFTCKKKVVYVVPLKALASEKYEYFTSLYQNYFSIGIASGDYDSED
ncbi:MAG: DEAD/DEAH box helicase, partial [Candidatus Woesearchaeota archaeon]